MPNGLRQGASPCRGKCPLRVRYRRGCADFNTSKVRLEGDLEVLTNVGVANFNTSKVRLEAVLHHDKTEAAIVFQYLEGAIRGTVVVPHRPEGKIGFQYLEGAIRGTNALL